MKAPSIGKGFADRAHNPAKRNIKSQIISGMRALAAVPISFHPSSFSNRQMFSDTLKGCERTLCLPHPDESELPNLSRKGFRAAKRTGALCVLASVSYVIVQYWQFCERKQKQVPGSITRELAAWSKWCNAERLRFNGSDNKGYTLEVVV